MIFLNNGKNRGKQVIGRCCYMKMTKENAKEIAKKSILSAEKYGFPLPSKKGKPVKKK